MAMKTQGTMLYFVDPDGFVVTQVGCVTGFTGLTTPRDQIDVTCLEDEAASSIAGLARPGQAQFTIAFDTADASHLRLQELQVEGVVLPWALGLSDGTAPPTSGDSSSFVLPSSRSFLEFDGYITDVPFDLALNSVITSQIGIQTSGFTEVHPKT